VTSRPQSAVVLCEYWISELSNGSLLEQAKIVEFMSQAGTYDPAPAVIDRIETHASFVFLAGDFAYKLKRAVRLPFLDFSTLEKRHWACLNELRLNARTAPQLYLEVVPVVVDANGNLCLRGSGEPVDWVLVMHRFDQEDLYDRMACEGRLKIESMHQLAAEVHALHRAADRTLTTNQGIVPLEKIISEHEDVLKQVTGDVLPRASADALAQRTRAAMGELRSVLKHRANTGFVRHCHGDLHLGNIVEIKGKPVLFDALEFNDSLATVDVLYDLSFLLMDLGKHGLEAHANYVLNSYLDQSETANLIGLATLPLFLSLRAVIRAKIALLRAEQASPERAGKPRDQARDFFELASRFLAPDSPKLIAVSGLSGSGKSTIARAIAHQIGGFPGAVIVRSDVERKRLFGVDLHTTLPQRAYTPEVSELVYALCRKRARFVLEGGRSVIVDAVHAKPEEREAIAAVAAECGAAFKGLWFDLSADLLQARVANRVGDVSDATPSVVCEQLSYDVGSIEFERIGTCGSVAEAAQRCLERIRDASS
jgi:aminoglycoside phosphotransferase family enzyme/predicted kinase